jgi:pimeloyl-ACP methyl ester carboxylesterase
VPETFIEDQMSAALTITKHVWQATLEGLFAAVPPCQSGSMRVPTLIPWGAEEDVLPAAQADGLLAAIEGSRRVIYGGTGHLVLWEQPERVAMDVAAFIAAGSQ